MGDVSPVVDDAPEAPGSKRARKTDERVLGTGVHAQEVTLKRAILHVHHGLKHGLIPLPKMPNKKKLPKGIVAKTGIFLGVSQTCVVEF